MSNGFDDIPFFDDLHREQAADPRTADPREPGRRIEQRHRVATAAERDHDDLAAPRRRPPPL